MRNMEIVPDMGHLFDDSLTFILEQEELEKHRPKRKEEDVDA